MSKVYFKGCTFWATVKVLHRIPGDDIVKTTRLEYEVLTGGADEPGRFASFLLNAVAYEKDKDISIINCGVIPPYVTEEEDIHVYSNGGQP